MKVGFLNQWKGHQTRLKTTGCTKGTNDIMTSQETVIVREKDEDRLGSLGMEKRVQIFVSITGE